MSVVTLPNGEKCYSWPNCSRHNVKPVSLADLRDQFNKRLDDLDNAKAAFTPLAKQKPAEIDGSLAELYDQLYLSQDNRRRAEQLAKQYQGYLADETRRRDSSLARVIRENGPDTQIAAIHSSYAHNALRYEGELKKFEAQAAAAEAQAISIHAEIEPFEAEYRRRGGWTRAFLVTNGNGHVHKSMACSTCRPTTRFAWLTDYSAHKEAEIVDDAGERACTVCYPSAPVDVLSRATRIFTPEEKRLAAEKAAKKAELDAKRAAKNAKKVTDEDGNVLEYRMFGDRTGGYSQPLNTETTARSALVELREKQLIRERHPGRWKEDPEAVSVWEEDYVLISAGLARKLGLSREQLQADITKRAEKKYKDNGYATWR